MFVTIPPHKRASQAALFHSMHRMLERTLPGDDDHRDQFDTGESVYVVVAADTGEVMAACRLNPTTQSHMFGELFPNFKERPPYSIGDGTWECSLFVIDQNLALDPIELLEIHCRLQIGLAIFCLDRGITEVSWLTHPQFCTVGRRTWKADTFGFAKRPQDRVPWIAAVSQVDQHTLDKMLDSYRDLNNRLLG